MTYDTMNIAMEIRFLSCKNCVLLLENKFMNQLLLLRYSLVICTLCSLALLCHPWQYCTGLFLLCFHFYFKFKCKIILNNLNLKINFYYYNDHHHHLPFSYCFGMKSNSYVYQAQCQFSTAPVLTCQAERLRCRVPIVSKHHQEVPLEDSYMTPHYC